jgi:hypothetical protein
MKTFLMRQLDSTKGMRETAVRSGILKEESGVRSQEIGVRMQNAEVKGAAERKRRWYDS